MNMIMGNIAKHVAICSSLSCLLMGCLDLDAPSCPEAPPEDVLYVHGTIGSDTEGTGECSGPFKTITKALAVANTSNARVIHVFGDSTPIVYGTATNGERFPLRLEKNGLTIEGDGDTKVILRGGGVCDPIDATASCAMAMVGSNVALRGVQIENIDGYGIRTTSPVVKLEDIFVTNCGASGILLHSDAALLARVRATKNANDGARAAGEAGVPYNVSIESCSFLNNGHRGFYGQNNGTITSIKSTYSDNNWSGAAFGDNVQVTSDGDTFERNDDGLAAVDGPTAYVVLDVRHALLQANKGNGINVAQAVSIKLRDSRWWVGGRGWFPARIAGEGTHVGTQNEPGGNMLQSSTTPNAIGLCFTGTGTMTAQGNHFGACPPSSNPDGACSGGMDIGGSGLVTLEGCVAP